MAIIYLRPGGTSYRQLTVLPWASLSLLASWSLGILLNSYFAWTTFFVFELRLTFVTKEFCTDAMQGSSYLCTVRIEIDMEAGGFGR